MASECGQANVGAEPTRIAKEVVAAQGVAATRPARRPANYKRLAPEAPEAPFWTPLAVRFCRMCAELARGQIRHAAVLQISLAGLGLDVDAVVGSERTEVLRALAPNARLRIDQNRGRAGLLVRASVLVRMQNRQDERRVPVEGIDVRAEDAIQHHGDRRLAAGAGLGLVALTRVVVSQGRRDGDERGDQGDDEDLQTHAYLREVFEWGTQLTEV